MVLNKRWAPLESRFCRRKIGFIFINRDVDGTAWFGFLKRCTSRWPPPFVFWRTGVPEILTSGLSRSPFNPLFLRVMRITAVCEIAH